jgi:hypothetical protein
MNDQPNQSISNHILPVSATMVGVCMTVISVIQLIPKNGMARMTDKILAVDGLFFLVSTLLSYWSLRHEEHRVRVERYADWIFVGGMILMTMVGFTIPFEIFHI